jgi:hypothetical protein
MAVPPLAAASLSEQVTPVALMRYGKGRRRRGPEREDRVCPAGASVATATGNGDEAAIRSGWAESPVDEATLEKARATTRALPQEYAVASFPPHRVRSPPSDN